MAHPRRHETLLLKIIVALSVLTSLYPPSAEAKKIVFIPLPVTSHIRSHIAVAEEMANFGHKSWVCVPDVLVRSNMSESSGVKILPYGNRVENLGNAVLTKSGMLENFWAGKGQDVFVVYKIGVMTWENSMDTLLDTRFWAGITRVKPDLVVLDWTPFCKTMLAVPYKLDIPFAFIGPYHDVVNAKVPHTSACNPEVMSDLNDRMTFFERLQNTLLHISFMTYSPFCDENILQKFVPEKKPITIGALSAKAEIFLAETDHIMDYPRPTLPNTKLIGGTAAKPAKPLHGPFKTFMDDSINGVAVVTFGTSILEVPQEISQKMISAFSQLGMNVVWRTNITSPNPDKIMTSTWIPQNDLLGHPNTKVFVSHCGLNGQYEALYHGVPILCLPIFADQYYNSRRVVNKGYGLRSDIRHVTSDELAQLMREIAYNVQYRESIKTASQIFKQLYKEPRKEAAFWLDHVLRFGGKYMRFAGQEMPLYQYLLLDVFTAILALLVISALLLYKFALRIFRLFEYKKHVKVD